MLRKILLMAVILLMLSGCDILPIDIIIEDYTATPSAACPTCPDPGCSTQPVVATATPGPATLTPDATETPEQTSTSEYTATVTLTSTATLKPTLTLTATHTLRPTSTPTNTQTPRPTLTPTLEKKPYEVQQSSPVYIQNFAHPDKGCNWMGVAGQVFSTAGKPVNNLVVVLEGTLDGQIVDKVGMTGLAKDYGAGGYEIVFSDKAAASSGSLFATLYDLSGNSLSYPVAFDTFADCKKNLVLVNFKQVK